MSSRVQKLLSVNNYHYKRGGAESVYFEHDALFRGLGWETAFFSMHHEKNVACGQENYFVDEIEFGRNYSLSKKLSDARKIIWSGEAKRKMAELLNYFKPDVAHIHSVYHHISPSVLPVLKDRGIPIVLTAHDLKLLCPAYTMLSNGTVCEKCRGGNTWNVLANKCIKNSTAMSALIGLESFVHRKLDVYAGNVDKVITPSRFYGDKFVEWGWPEEQVTYIPNYVEADQFEPNYEPGEYFLYFGRLNTNKGVATLIKAAAKAGAKLLIAGTGPDEAIFRDLVDELDADVEFLGFQSGDALFDLIRQSRAVVLPSEWYENAPISLLEAYALGKPVIGSDMGGIPEMIEDGVSGWLFASGSADELAERLQSAQAMSDKQVADMGRSARQLVQERYTSAIYLESMLAVYAELGV